MFLTSPFIDQAISQVTPKRYTRLRSLCNSDFATVIPDRIPRAQESVRVLPLQWLPTDGRREKAPLHVRSVEVRV